MVGGGREVPQTCWAVFGLQKEGGGGQGEDRRAHG